MWFATALAVACLFGGITDYLAKSKGYEKGFAWGFWLGIIGLLVVGFRPANYDTIEQEEIATDNEDDISKLERLARLHDSGSLSDEEFDELKKKILKNIK